MGNKQQCFRGKIPHSVSPQPQASQPLEEGLTRVGHPQAIEGEVEELRRYRLARKRDKSFRSEILVTAVTQSRYSTVASTCTLPTVLLYPELGIKKLEK
ncbi:hypothetical protein CEXT_735411 [Caerostris extrusa]|uniref:Uncharacterized protein n=1 Tax=Caerostris extrusa TaxID=172846 RepID=A0AAV4T5M4_CAEEX|nr:hypothetical protein CEXT_735411 [Caerostris extrusa]